MPFHYFPTSLSLSLPPEHAFAGAAQWLWIYLSVSVQAIACVRGKSSSLRLVDGHYLGVTKFCLKLTWPLHLAEKMVKREDFENNENPTDIKVKIEDLPDTRIPSSSFPPPPVHKTEECLLGSSSCHMKTYFVAMGFSPKLVDEVLKKHGKEDTDALLEILLAHSCVYQDVDGSSCFSHGLDIEKDEQFTSESEDEESCEYRNLASHKRSSLLAMNFSTEEVGLAMKILGGNASLTELVDFIIACQMSENSREKDSDGSVGTLGKCKETSLEAMFGTMDTTLHLLDMGFTEQEISSAIANFGSEISVHELANKILATRVPCNYVKEEEAWSDDSSDHSCQSGQRHFGHSTEESRSCFTAPKLEETRPEYSAMNPYGEVQVGKMPEYVSVYNKTEGCSKHSFSAMIMGEETTSSLEDVCDSKKIGRRKRPGFASGCGKPSIYPITKKAVGPKLGDECHETPGSLKDFVNFSSGFSWINKLEQCKTNQNICQSTSKPPFFFYGNVVDVSQGTWEKLSHFLFGIEPEYVNTQFFSAFIRDEGYVHNLPKENRCYIIPKPPMTIQDALPCTKKWWPSWDTRKQCSCISLDTLGVPHICRRLEKMLMDSHGILSKEQQMDVLHQCKTLNLLWTGEHSLTPIEPSQIEQILGYPMQHTQVEGLELIDRLRILKCSFQTDALGYHVSVLKKMFPSGLRVLSLFSGIGGAEVALHRLGIHLKYVISVEASQLNRRILRNWWQNTGQSGVLQQIEGIEKLTSKKVEALIEQVGGFDIVIGGSPCTCTYRGPTSGRSLGLDMKVFYEYVRVLRTIRSAMRQN